MKIAIRVHLRLERPRGFCVSPLPCYNRVEGKNGRGRERAQTKQYQVQQPNVCSQQTPTKPKASSQPMHN